MKTGSLSCNTAGRTTPYVPGRLLIAIGNLLLLVVSIHVQAFPQSLSAGLDSLRRLETIHPGIRKLG